MFLKEIVKTYVKYAFNVTEAHHIRATHQDMFFLKTQGRPVRNLWIILKKRKENSPS
jgi:hypothetical protein